MIGAGGGPELTDNERAAAAGPPRLNRKRSLAATSKDSMWKTGLVICILACLNRGSFGQSWEGHTSPDKWTKPRVFHTPFDPKYETRILTSTVAFEDKTGKVLSPNEGYWFSIEAADTTRDSPWSTTVYVYSERPYLIRIEFKDHASYGVTAKWINEKLLYLDVWWGRVLGSYLIYDVEKEECVIKEMQQDGGIPFQQWQQMKKPQANNSLHRTSPRTPRSGRRPAGWRVSSNRCFPYRKSCGLAAGMPSPRTSEMPRPSLLHISRAVPIVGIPVTLLRSFCGESIV